MLGKRSRPGNLISRRNRVVEAVVAQAQLVSEVGLNVWYSLSMNILLVVVRGWAKAGSFGSVLGSIPSGGVVDVARL